jgi:hypothetical protein
MQKIVVEQRLGRGGVLELRLPLGEDQAGRDVRVTVEPLDPTRAMTPEEWRTGILATAGTWQGEFESPAPGTLEEREPLS